MTELSVYQKQETVQPCFHHYSVQTDAQRKKGGGLGRSEQSYWKHDEIEKFMKRQLPILNKRGRGCIIDMHSGDGKDTPHPQPDMFSGGSLKTTPTMAIQYARKYDSDVILCERNKNLRDGLTTEYGDSATIIGNNKSIIEMGDALSVYSWIMVLNDPNGYGDQSVDVMVGLSKIVPVSDFIIVFNLHSLKRPMGLARNPEKNANHTRPSVRGSFKSGIENQWMLNDDEWKSRLGKKSVLSVGPRRISEEMTAKILLVSNFIPGVK